MVNRKGRWELIHKKDNIGRFFYLSVEIKKMIR